MLQSKHVEEKLSVTNMDSTNASSKCNHQLNENNSNCRHAVVNVNQARHENIMRPTFSKRLLQALLAVFLRIVSHFWRACTAGGLILIISWWVYGGWLFSCLFTLSVMGLLYHGQDLLLYYPDQPPTARLYVDLPSTVQLPYEEHFIKTQDGVSLNAFFIKHPSPACRTILYLHGNAGNIGNRLVNAHGFYTYCGCNVLLVEYRGYGHSGGSPTESGMYKDATAALNFLLERTDIDQSKIVVFGRSLGGAIALYLASSSLFSQHISAVILENTFTSIRDIAAVLFRTHLITYVPLFVIKNQYLSLERISRVTQPTLFLSGLSDDLIPPHMMTALYQKCGARLKRLHTYDRGGHNDTWTCPNYYSHLFSFFAQIKSHHSTASPHYFTNTASFNIHTV